MTEKELNKLGFEKIRPNYYMYAKLFIYDNFYITSNHTISDILEQMYNFGIAEGIERGKEKKVNEIKRVLNIPVDNEL